MLDLQFYDQCVSTLTEAVTRLGQGSVDGPLHEIDRTRLLGIFDACPIPILVDMFGWTQLPPHFQSRIMNRHAVFYKRGQTPT